MPSRNWCDTCRGDGGQDDELLKCAGCARRFHVECAGLRKPPSGGGWRCPFCVSDDDGGDGDGDAKADRKRKNSLKKKIAAVRKSHTGIRRRSKTFFSRERAMLEPFVSDSKLAALCGTAAAADAVAPLTIDEASPPFLNATLRDYQVRGVNWLLSRYACGVGGILADEMGLGKTIQTLTFLAALKSAGMPGPHLVVVPFAVLQNWSNEIKKFTPGLSHVRIHGSLSERDRMMTMDDVSNCGYDVYLTTYDTLMAEETFFTESFLFHTIVIDEGHRLKNANSKLCKCLSRVTVPFRVLLTGTPLQNNLGELYALLHYILPMALEKPGSKGECVMSSATSAENGGRLDRALIGKARSLLEVCMIRRVKSEVESALLPKMEYVLRPPLTRLQRRWYRSFIVDDGSADVGLLTANQLMSKMMQLGKVANHPKTLALTFDRERERLKAKARAAAGSEFVKIGTAGPTTAKARAAEAELRDLVGEKLVSSSGKLALLDRLITSKRPEGSRFLIFAQYTLTLDILEEYMRYRFGALGSEFLRLDGSTNRIQREMDMRSFNSPGSSLFAYLISTRAGGQGINLATADTVVLYDTSWNPQIDLQAQDRAHRIGQLGQVKVYRLIAESTVEERILSRARQKMVLDALVIKNKGEGDDLVAALNGGGGGDKGGDENDELAKLNVDELWSMLCQGADRILDPSADEAEDLTLSDYDRLLASARPVRWDDAIADSNVTEEVSLAPVRRKKERHRNDEYDGSNVVKATDSSDDSVLLPKFKPRGQPQARTPETVPASVATLKGTIFSQRGKSSSVLEDEMLCTHISAVVTTPKVKIPDCAEDCTSADSVRRSKRPRTPRKFFTPPEMFMSQVKKKTRKIRHDNRCFGCQKKPEKDEFMSCMICPRVYHLKCGGLSRWPKSRSWYCPWHSCKECGRKSSNAGGTLFHCVSCPLAYCFDCCPDKYIDRGQSTSAEAIRAGASLEWKGVTSTKSYLFFKCGMGKCNKRNHFSIRKPVPHPGKDVYNKPQSEGAHPAKPIVIE